MSIANTRLKDTVRAESAVQVENVFRAFTDRTRLRILYLLQGGELCVSDIVGILQLPQAKVSHHLKYLCQAGLIDGRKDGLWCFYRLIEAQTPLHQSLFSCLGHCCNDLPECADDQKLAAEIKASGGCCPK